MKRRRFLQLSAGTFLAAPHILNEPFTILSKRAGSPVICVSDPMAQSLEFISGKAPNSDGVIVDKVISFSLNYNRIAVMVDTAITKLTGRSKVGKAWESLFPQGHPNSNTRIGIKVNFSYGWMDGENDWNKTLCPYGPKAAITDAIVSGLTQMLDGTFPAENILIYDLGHSVLSGINNPVVQGFRLVHADSHGFLKDRQKGRYGLHWFDGRGGRELPADAPEFLAAPDFPEPYRAPQRIIPPVYESNFTINLAVAKDHREAGITGVMKNTFGCTDKCSNTHGNEWMNIESPYAGSKVCASAFYKTINQYSPCILNIMDALAGVYQGGPTTGKIFRADTIAMSKDPVAVEMYLLRLINTARKENNHSALTTEGGRAADGHPNASFIRVAHDLHRLGDMSLDNIREINIAPASGRLEIPSLQESQSRLSEVRKSGRAYCLSINMDDSGREHKILSHITDLTGRTRRTFHDFKSRSSQVLLECEMVSDERRSLDPGVYQWHVNIDGFNHVRTINTLQELTLFSKPSSRNPERRFPG
ncbi:MAG TPA: DUF362 domain-containing protein [Cyclobacteriaceae bacterium]|nr:DUF362 domain-containing protein [Cyclobacteriaceae bacterium]